MAPPNDSSLVGHLCDLIEYTCKDARGYGMQEREHFVCSLGEAGNTRYELNGVFFHLVQNVYEGKDALVECATSPIHIERLIKAPRFSSEK